MLFYGTDYKNTLRDVMWSFPRLFLEYLLLKLISGTFSRQIVLSTDALYFYEQFHVTKRFLRKEYAP
jgi:hypothetical protein